MGNLLTRRQIIVGATTASLASVIPSALGRGAKELVANPSGIASRSEWITARSPFRCYMASSAILSGGGILVSGGYASKNVSSVKACPRSACWIYHPLTEEWTQIASLNLARARHASVLLSDGRIAVLGGYHMGATASVEVYDPTRNEWEVVEPLLEPRYDHSAVADGQSVYVIGGVGKSIIGNIEILPMPVSSSSLPV